MKCLVIGGSGFIGSFLIKKLISEKNEVVNFDLQDSNISEVNTIIGDINNREDLDNIKSDFDIVYILAAVHKDDVSDYTEYYRTNCNGLDNIINFFKGNNIDRIVYFSSAAVYGDKSVKPRKEKEITSVASNRAATEVMGAGAAVAAAIEAASLARCAPALL